jgi:nicotinamide-nucleotide amidase
MINASIITIGDELLIGQVIDTNSAFIAQEMNKAGFAVVRRVAVGDNATQIKNALDQEKIYSDIILITGGLGPTADDITKPLLCEYFGGKMIVDNEVYEHVKNIFENIIKRPFTDRNKKQAEVPDVCTVIKNNRGTAPGMLFAQTLHGIEKTFVSMPGVPQEMKGMMVDDVIPMLIKKYSTAYIAHRTLLLAGVGESTIADMLESFESELPNHLKLAYLPNYGLVRLRLTSILDNETENNKILQEQFEKLQKAVKGFLVSTKDEPMEEVLCALLQAKNKTLCTAESCTGGYMAHLITSIPGSSSFYDGSVVSYSYQAKEDLLQVKNNTLTTHGAVSEEVVKEMAAGALENIQSDYTIAVSGIMGPGGGMPDKPTGTVWICVGNNKKLVAQKMHFRFDRTLNIKLTAMNAFNMLRKFILEEAE